MAVLTPHGPVHEDVEFWYDPEERSLLYEVNITQGRGEAEADHLRCIERGYLTHNEAFNHEHYDPHGFTFEDKELEEPQRVANIDNTELIIRLWCQVEAGEQPTRTRRREPLLPVPKPLALFLSSKRAEMYKPESLTQALLLLQSHIMSKDKQKCPSLT